MIKVKSIIIFVLFLSLFSCNKEEELTPSNKDVDLYARTNNEDSDIDKLIYQIYQETGYPILYTDTVGKLFIDEDEENNKYYMPQIIDLKYNIIGRGKCEPGLAPSLLTSEESINDGIIFVKDHVIPNIPENIIIKSFLLCDHFNAKDYYGNYYELTEKHFHWCISALAISNISKLNELSTDELIDFKNDLFIYLFTELIQKSDYVDLLNKFKKFSKHEWEDFYFYGMDASTWTEYTNKNGLAMAPRGEYGFIVINGNEDDGYYYTPKIGEDIHSYIKAVINNNETQFKDMYKNFPRVIGKYDLIKDFILNTLKYKL